MLLCDSQSCHTPKHRPPERLWICFFSFQIFSYLLIIIYIVALNKSSVFKLKYRVFFTGSAPCWVEPVYSKLKLHILLWNRSTFTFLVGILPFSTLWTFGMWYVACGMWYECGKYPFPVLVVVGASWWYWTAHRKPSRRLYLSKYIQVILQQGHSISRIFVLTNMFKNLDKNFLRYVSKWFPNLDDTFANSNEAMCAPIRRKCKLGRLQFKENRPPARGDLWANWKSNNTDREEKGKRNVFIKWDK